MFGFEGILEMVSAESLMACGALGQWISEGLDVTRCFPYFTSEDDA